MNDLILNDKDIEIVDSLVDSLPNAILLTGPVGIGLLTLAKHLAGSRLEAIIHPTDSDEMPTLSDNGVIRVNQIRHLVAITTTKTSHRKVIIIDDSDKMNHASQNAFLKSLEEPPGNTHFILTSHKPSKLLPTIVSRVQTVAVESVPESTTLIQIKNLGITDETKTRQLVFLASGLPAEISRLVSDDQYFEHQSELAKDARRLLGGTHVDKIALIEKYYSSRPDTLDLLLSAKLQISKSIHAQADKRLIELAERLEYAFGAVLANGNIRLQLTNLII